MIKRTALLLSTALVLSISTFTYAGGGGYAGKHTQKLEQLTQELSLSAEQKVQMEAVFKEQHEKFRAIHEESRNRIQQILTPEQMQRWEGMQQERREKHTPKTDNGQMQ